MERIDKTQTFYPLQVRSLPGPEPSKTPTRAWFRRVLRHCLAPSRPNSSCVTKGHTPFRLNLHARDVGHTIIFGPTGKGKSTLLALIIAQLCRYRDMSIFVFDKGMSIYPLTTASGGSH